MIDLKHLEYLSKLKINEKEKQRFEQDFEKILQFVDEITLLELPEEEKSVGVTLDDLRQDEIIEKEKCDTLANAPEKQDECFVVPLVVE
ncbi:MAG: Asp-tRNA(Asn)/Glu-tRNA(Gln) amidotransferase subunit GatC [Clostridiales bacterium]|nr:Asp-tRNA(Asn)/Glu-tRNA(Gln) amidotransferase subunit GatC [Clostridiales bacterium]